VIPLTPNPSPNGRGAGVRASFSPWERGSIKARFKGEGKR